MPTIMDFYNSGLTAAGNQVRDKYLDPQLRANLLKAQTENQYLPDKMRLANEHQEQVNQYYGPSAAAQIENQKLINAYYGRDKESEISLREAQTAQDRFKASNPLLGQPGIAGQIAAALFLQNNGPKGGLGAPLGVNPGAENEIPSSNSAMDNAAPLPTASGMGSPQNLSNLIMQGVTDSLKQRRSLSDYRGKQTQAYNYMSLPVDQKSSLLAQAAGMGYDPTQATQLFMDGHSIEDLAKTKGFGMDNLPEPIYPTTKTSLNQIQKRQQALAEIDKLNPVLTSAIKPYSNRFHGYSLKQISEALSGENPDSQARYLAARALTPEMSALRLRAMGGNVGIEALREVTNASMANIKAFQTLVNGDVYQKANQYVDQWINDAVSAANSRGLKTYGTDASKKNSENDPLGIRSSGTGKDNDPLGIR